MASKRLKLNKDKLWELATVLEADLPKLQSDESYQKHDPTYYNYVVYYEDLVETLLQLGGKVDVSLFGAYLVGLIAYQVMELETPLYEAVRMVINELKVKINLLEAQEAKATNKDKESSDDEPKFDA